MEINPLIVVGTPKAGEGDEQTVLDNWRRASETGIGCVIVNSDGEDPVLTAPVKQAGGYIYVDPEPPEGLRPNYETESGAERVAASVNKFDRFYNHDIIINVYAKLPMIAADAIKALLYPLAFPAVDIATLVTPLSDEQWNSEDWIKAEVEWAERTRVHVLTNSKVGQITKLARRSEELGEREDCVCLTPIYAYKRAALDRFLRFEPTMREMEERLEPERALANNMRVDAIMIQ